MNRNLDRRTFVRGVGAVTIAGAIAGCSGGGGGSGGGDETDGGGGGGDETSGGDTTDSGNGGGGGGVPSAVSDYLSNDDSFGGSVVDETGSDSVTVTVGAEGNGGGFAFDPSAVRVSSGTTITFEWTGEGGQHNVVAEEGGDFESELTSESGYTFEHTFESSGTVLYYCSPHKSLGMRGAVIVE
jgi:halocyanin-like protein